MAERRRKEKKKKRDGEVVAVKVGATWLTWLNPQGQAFPGYAERRVLQLFGSNPLPLWLGEKGVGSLERLVPEELGLILKK